MRKWNTLAAASQVVSPVGRGRGLLSRDEGVLTLGPWLELDTTTERFVGDGADAANELRARNQRKPHIVPDLERNTVAAS